MLDALEENVRFGVEWLRLLVEVLGAVVVAIGFVVAIIGLLRHAILERGTGFTSIRLSFARYLTLALELQLAADILSTSISPTWDQLGKLAAIAVIRTMLNHFLMKEMREEQAESAGSAGSAGQLHGAAGNEEKKQ